MASRNSMPSPRRPEKARKQPFLTDVKILRARAHADGMGGMSKELKG